VNSVGKVSQFNATKQKNDVSVPENVLMNGDQKTLEAKITTDTNAYLLTVIGVMTK